MPGWLDLETGNQTSQVESHQIKDLSPDSDFCSHGDAECRESENQDDDESPSVSVDETPAVISDIQRVL